MKLDWKKFFNKKYWKVYAIILVALALVTTLVVWLCTKNNQPDTPERIDGKLVLTRVSISGGNSPAEKNAVAELQKYLQKKGVHITNTNAFPITVSIDSSLGEDAFLVKATVGEDKSEQMSIVGGNGRGVLYGVYQFLEKYASVRFFTPELEICEKGTVAIPDGVLLDVSPTFDMRHTDWYNWMAEDTKYEWATKNGVNIMNGWKRSWNESLGGSICYAPDLFVHSISRLLADPNVSSPATSPNPCLSDENVYNTVLANVRKALEKDPNTKIVSISQNDNQSYCQCEKCAETDALEGSPTGTLLRFVNRIAADLEADYPDLTIDTLAYQYTRKAPAITKPRDNVCIRLCSIECHFNHPLTTESCAVCSKFREDIQAWSEICDNLYIWDYTTNYRYYLTTFPNFHVLRENMQFFATHNVKGVYEQGNGNSRSGEFGEMRAYLIAKLLMNPYMTAEEYDRHMTEFMQAYYGAGWENVRQYLDAFTNFATTSSAGMGIYSSPFTVFSPDDLIELEQTLNNLWDAAEELAGDRLDAVKRSRWQLRYLLLYIHPDEAAAKQLIDEAAALNVAWREGLWHVSPSSNLSLPPDTWSFTK